MAPNSGATASEDAAAGPSTAAAAAAAAKAASPPPAKLTKSSSTSPPSYSATTFSSTRRSLSPKVAEEQKTKRGKGQAEDSSRSRSPSPNTVASGSTPSSSKRLHSPTSPSPSKVARTGENSRASPDRTSATRTSPARTSPARTSPARTSPSASSSQRRQPSPSSRESATSPLQSPSASRKGKFRASAATADEGAANAASPHRAIGGAVKAPTSASERVVERSQGSPAPASATDLPEAAPQDRIDEVNAADSSGGGNGSNDSANSSLDGQTSEIELAITDGGPPVRVPTPLMLTSTIPRGSYHQCGTARRVKVYELLNETWQDRGTGYCAGVYDEGQDEALLVARTETECLKIDGALPDPRRFKVAGGLQQQQQQQGATADGGNNEQQQVPTASVGEPTSHPYYLIVSENLDSEKILLKSRVVKEDVYQKQQDTLVVWTEPDGTDMALSFQEADGCHEVWEFIVEVQKHFQLNSNLGQDSLSDPPTPDPGSPQSQDFSMSALGVGGVNMLDTSAFSLPDPTLGNVEEIDMFIKGSAQRGPTARERMAEWVVRGEYIRKLCPVFHDAEDLENLEALHCLCSIMQTIVMLNDSMIIEMILSDDVFLSVVGMFEYDPDFPTLKASYRDYLRNTATFKQVVEIEDPKVITKIHQVYRLQYLKDVILARILDDAMFSVLNSWIFFHQVDIVQFCTSDEKFLPKVFAICAPDSTESREKKHDCVFFLQNLCAMGKQIQLPARIALYRTLAESGLLNVLEFAMVEKEKKVQDAAAEMLMVTIEYDPNSVRNHVLEQVDEKRQTLVAIMSDLLHEEEDLGLKAQICESLRTLFDTGAESGPPNATMAAAAAAARTKGDPERFLTWLYEADVEHLFSPLKTLPKVTAHSSDSRLNLSPRPRSALFGHLCDLLCYSVAQHTFRSQYFVITSVIAAHVGSLLFAREKHMKLAAVRFFRACIGSNNQFTNRHFIKQEIFAAVLTLTEQESKRDNLVLSACLDLFDHIARERMKPLMDHLLKEHGVRLAELADGEYTGKVFSALLQTAIDCEGSGGSGARGSSVEAGEGADPSSSQVFPAGGGSQAKSPDEDDNRSSPGDGPSNKSRERDRAARGFGAPGSGLDLDEDAYFNGPGSDSDEEDNEEDENAKAAEHHRISGIMASAAAGGASEGDLLVMRSTLREREGRMNKTKAMKGKGGRSGSGAATSAGTIRGIVPYADDDQDSDEESSNAAGASTYSSSHQGKSAASHEQVPTMEELLLGTPPSAPITAPSAATPTKRGATDDDDLEGDADAFDRRVKSKRRHTDEDDDGEEGSAGAGEGGFIRSTTPLKTYSGSGGGGTTGGAKKISLGLSSSSKQMAAENSGAEADKSEGNGEQAAAQGSK